MYRGPTAGQITNALRICVTLAAVDWTEGQSSAVDGVNADPDALHVASDDLLAR